MQNKEKVQEKEKQVRALLDRLRNGLNQGRIRYDKTPNDWSYITTLSHTEKHLKELVAFIEATPE